MPMLAHDTDYFHIVRRAVLRRLRIADMLTDRVLVREKLFRHFFVDDRYTPRILVFAFVLGEIAAPQEFYAERVAVAGRDSGVERIDAWIRCLRIIRHGVFCAQNAAGAREIGIRQHGADGGRGYAGQLSYAPHHVEDQSPRISRRFLNQSEIELSNEIAGRDKPRVESGCFERATKK